MDLYEALREKFLEMIHEHRWGSETVRVTAKPLTPGEAIGMPEHQDYPLLKGKERLVEAEFRGAIGHAFTDMFGSFHGLLAEVAVM